jgi:hypothetical protein
MASLVLSGDTSGSITVSAPAVAGSNTQTLVATTGTLAPIVSGTAITLTNQTAPEFTGIPSWVKRITVVLNGVSANNTGSWLLQIGDAGGYETSGYAGTGDTWAATPGASLWSGSGFRLNQSTTTAAAVNNAIATLVLLGSNTWVFQYVGGNTNAASLQLSAGAKTLSDTLTQIRLYVDGTIQFDAGTINILYE